MYEITITARLGLTGERHKLDFGIRPEIPDAYGSPFEHCSYYSSIRSEPPSACSRYLFQVEFEMHVWAVIFQASAVEEYKEVRSRQKFNHLYLLIDHRD